MDDYTNKEKTQTTTSIHVVPAQSQDAVKLADDARLAELGYKSEFKREFSVSIENIHLLVVF